MSKITEISGTNNNDAVLFALSTQTLTMSANVLLNSFRALNLAGGGITANILTAGAPVNKQLFIANTSGGTVFLTADNGVTLIGGLTKVILQLGQVLNLIWGGTTLLIQQ